jgi:hypothetical protein
VVSSDDELVKRYLARLNAAASQMPADRRRELIDEITAHIEEAMAVKPTPPGGISTVLDQLGSPEEIVAEADAWLAGGPSSQPSGQFGAVEIIAIVALLVGGIILPVVGWLVGVVLLWMSPRWKAGDKLLATLVWPGGLLAPVVAFLVLGATALFTASVCDHVQSPGLTGTSVSGGRKTTVFDHASSGAHCPPPAIQPWLAITLAIVVMLAAVAGPILVAIRLIRQARRAGSQPEEADQDFITTPLPA